MADAISGFEQQDNDGSTELFNGTVGTGGITLPAVADKIIAEFVFISRTSNKDSLVSLVGAPGTWRVRNDGAFGWTPKGGIKQLTIAAETGTIEYSLAINYEEFSTWP